MTVDKQVLKVGPFKDVIPDAVRVGDEVYLSGAVSIGEDGAPLHAGDIFAQMRQVYANIEAVLKQFDADLGNLVKETIFVTDVQSFTGSEEAIEQFAKIRAEVFGGYPEVAQSLVQVSDLVMPGLMIEIEAVARL
ncbi:MAG TPA: RidA family protein [Polyangia bacterium]|jgi:2-iminobutanoate/2-iminopropanoate deaminase|nr:RidA family protein [Polyangia bacterium]